MIPERLHRGGRPKLEEVSDDDLLFMRHSPLPEGSDVYEFAIPDHVHLEDQSVNSDFINGPRGLVKDVLHNTKTKEYEASKQVACFDVGSIKSLDIPNQKSVIYGKGNKVKKEADRFSFQVVHLPEEEMYPHCIIAACKNGKAIRDVASGVKTDIKMAFAEIANKHRVKTQARIAMEDRRQVGRLSRIYYWLRDKALEFLMRDNHY